MCGIAGIFFHKPTDSLNLIEKMIQSIHHRGPDGRGVVLFQPQSFVALGHCRLSILDLSEAGHQPMCDIHERYWVSYNGEIYNAFELRSELEEMGYCFRSNTDTEVILSAFAAWGEECLARFNGMFAFILYDKKEKCVFAARDRFGIKPLYYWVSPEGVLAIASEIKQFTCLPGWEAKLNGQCAYDFLNWGVLDHTEETFFSGVHQLCGGEFLTVHLQEAPRVNIQRWYRLAAIPFMGSFEEASLRFSELIEDSVRLRLLADVEVGSSLSGGLDSSTIACLIAKKLRSSGQKTFSAASDVLRFDESSFIKEVVQQTQVENHMVYPTCDALFSVCDQMIWQHDEPFTSTSMFAQWKVFEMASKNNVKVLLDGQGADEHLGGYLGFFGNRYYELFTQLQWGALVGEIWAAKAHHSPFQSLSLLGNKLVPNALKQPIRRWLKKDATGPHWLNCEKLGARDRAPFTGHHSMQKQSMQQISSSHLPMLLHFVDRNAMAHSVEARTPFLDYRLVEFVLGLPSQYKLAQGVTKRTLRESSRGLIPEVVRNRVDKMGFVTAEEEWMKGESRPRFEKALIESIEASQGVFTREAVPVMHEILDGNVPFHFLPWRLICFGKWMRRFSVKV